MIRPASSTPAEASTSVAGRKVSKKNSSFRLHATWTGTPASRERRTASSAWLFSVLPPKPPPTKGVRTRTFSSGTPRSSAAALRSGKGVWVEAQTVARSPSTRASAAWGSMGAWAM